MSETTASAKAAESDKTVGKNKRGAKKDVNDPSFNMDEIRELADLVDEYGFTDFEFENENIRVRLSKMTAAPMMQAPSPVQHAAVAPASSPAKAEAGASAPAASPDEDLFKITSPIVGTFYRSPGPDKEAYVKEGSTVSPDTVVCIVEAMKLMNEIQAETSGEVVKIYVENGQPVEYGQPLFGIRK
jgi:acetyl-CoA carboxylase biotin carboxyl carrier protein